MDQPPFRFTAQLTRPLVDGPVGRAWAESARLVEGLGYTALSMPDHFGDQLAPIPALAAAAAATSTLRLTMTVLANDFRHPVVLAKEAATLDVLSDGRLELGLGAGWMRTEYEASGIPLDPPGVRIERLEEAVAVITGLWAADPCTFAGRHYQVTGLEGFPKPVQRPRPPLILGGGARRMLSLAARLADTVNVALDNRTGEQGADSGQSARDDRVDEKLAWIHAAAEGRPHPPALAIRVVATAVTDDVDAAAARLGAPLGLNPAEVVASPHALIGTVDAIIERLVGLRERYGFSTFVVSATAVEALAPVVARLVRT